MTRWDDEHRGPAVTDALQLNDCLMELEASSINWPARPEEESARFQALFAATYPADQLPQALLSHRRHEGAINLIVQAALHGDLQLWVREDGRDTQVARSALLEFDRNCVLTGVYMPPNDRGWLLGRPLFVKRRDWETWLSRQSIPEKSDRSKPPVNFDELVSFLQEQKRKGAISDGGRQGYPAAQRAFPDHYVAKATVLEAWKQCASGF